jgi:hypothetical protein
MAPVSERPATKKMDLSLAIQQLRGRERLNIAVPFDVPPKDPAPELGSAASTPDEVSEQISLVI